MVQDTQQSLKKTALSHAATQFSRKRTMWRSGWRSVRRNVWCTLGCVGWLATLSASCSAAVSLDLHNATPAATVTITTEQQQQLKQKPRKAALVWHGTSAWVNAVTAGAKEEFAKAGVEVVAVTDANYDPARQASDIENASTLRPDFILSLVIDANSVRASYQKAIAQGSKLVLLSNPVPGIEHGPNMAGIVTDDMLGMGKQAAAVMASTGPSLKKVGMIFHDADYFVTNSRDKAFEQALANYPNLQLVAKKGFVREQETSEVAAAMLLQQPDLDLIYVSWDAAAEGVVEALRAAGRANVKVVTYDLGVNNLLDLARGGHMLATIADQPYNIGQTMARVALLAELNQPTPALTIVPYTTVQRDNIADSWQGSYRTAVPPLLQQVLTKEKSQ